MQDTQSIQAPSRVSSPWRDAYERALAENEPVLVPWSHYCDDRGWSLMNLLAGVMSREGQINYSTQYPGVVKAWHRHHDQTDFWCCLTGHLKVGVHRESDEQIWTYVLGEKRPGVLIIPPTLWHGAATVGDIPAGLLYYVTKSFNPSAPDEERRAYDSIPGFDWGVEHR